MNHVQQQIEDPIELRLPGTPAHVPAARTLAAELAARMDFTLDAVDDLRMAVDEVCSTLVGKIEPTTALTCAFDASSPDAIIVRVSAKTRDGKLPSRDTFGWRVLTALVDTVDTGTDSDNTVWIQLCKHRIGNPL